MKSIANIAKRAATARQTILQQATPGQRQCISFSASLCTTLPIVQNAAHTEAAALFSVDLQRQPPRLLLQRDAITGHAEAPRLM